LACLIIWLSGVIEKLVEREFKVVLDLMNLSVGLVVSVFTPFKDSDPIFAPSKIVITSVAVINAVYKAMVVLPLTVNNCIMK
jgi:hypothetical protein